MTDLDRRTFLKTTGTGVAALAVLPQFVNAAPRTTVALPVGVIGVGRQGRAIVGELQKMEAVTLASICDADERRLNSSKRRAPNARLVGNYQEMLDDPEIKAVFIATPTHAHAKIVQDAIAAGKHVYCEAPIAHTIEDAQAIAAAARGADVVVQAGLLARSNPIYKLARKFFRSDSVRDVVSLRAQYYRKTSWRSPAREAARDRALNWRLYNETSTGLAGEFGTHQFDAINWYLGEYPVSAHGGGSIRAYEDGREVYDSIAGSLTYANGVALQYQSSLGNSFEGMYEVFNGTNAAIKLAWTAGWMFKEADAPTQGWEVYANRQQFHNDEGITLIADATKLAAQGRLTDGVGLPNPPIHYGVNDFLRSVIEGDDIVSTIDEGMRATICGIALNDAVKSGTNVSIPDALLKG